MDNAGDKHQETDPGPGPSRGDVTERTFIPKSISSIIVSGLAAANYHLTQQQVSDQYIGSVAQACAPDDLVAQEALHTYLSLLLSIIRYPNYWLLESEQLPLQIAQHGQSWYATALASAQRNTGERATSEELSSRFGPSIAAVDVAGHSTASNNASTANRMVSDSAQKQAELYIDTEMAQVIAPALRHVGYIANLEEIVGQSIAEVARAYEPSDLIRRQAILAYLSHQIQVSERSQRARFNRHDGEEYGNGIT